MATPHDFVREPATWAPIQTPGQATFRELLGVLADPRQVPLVGQQDREMGPYTACIVVSEADVDAWCARGYRKLTPYEDDQSCGLPPGAEIATD